MAGQADALLTMLHETMASVHRVAVNNDSRYEAMQSTAKNIQSLLTNHYQSGRHSRLASLEPQVQSFFSPMQFAEAFEIYNDKFQVTKRRYQPVSFEEIRHMCNIGTVIGLAQEGGPQLISFDGDGTLYHDGKNFEEADLIEKLTELLRSGIYVALVTAAAYEDDGSKYIQRLQGLIDHFESSKLPEDAVERFFVFGGECNYLLSCSLRNNKVVLRPVPDSKWVAFHSVMSDPNFASITSLYLDLMESVLKEAQNELKLRTRIIRKSRAVGLVSRGGVRDDAFEEQSGSGRRQIKQEILEEIVSRCDSAFNSCGLTVPHCIFNGGSDVWCDIGDKAIGIQVLQRMLNISSNRSCHIGDQFTSSGNDIAARAVSPTLFIRSPKETRACLTALQKQMQITEMLATGSGCSLVTRRLNYYKTPVSPADDETLDNLSLDNI